MNSKIENFTDLKEHFLAGLNQAGANLRLIDHDLNNFLYDVKNNFINQKVRLANRFGMKGIQIGYRKPTNEHDALLKLDSFEEINQAICLYFAQFTKDDRIKELLFEIDAPSLLSSGQIKFRHSSDLSDLMQYEEVAEALKIMSRKKIRMYYDNQNFFGQNLKELLKLAYNQDLKIGTENVLARQECFINSNNDFLKVNLHKDCFYISFGDPKIHHDFLIRSIEKIKSWWIR